MCKLFRAPRAAAAISRNRCVCSTTQSQQLMNVRQSIGMACIASKVAKSIQLRKTQMMDILHHRFMSFNKHQNRNPSDWLHQHLSQWLWQMCRTWVVCLHIPTSNKRYLTRSVWSACLSMLISDSLILPLLLQSSKHHLSQTWHCHSYMTTIAEDGLIDDAYLKQIHSWFFYCLSIASQQFAHRFECFILRNSFPSVSCSGCRLLVAANAIPIQIFIVQLWLLLLSPVPSAPYAICIRWSKKT